MDAADVGKACFAHALWLSMLVTLKWAVWRAIAGNNPRSQPILIFPSMFCVTLAESTCVLILLELDQDFGTIENSCATVVIARISRMKSMFYFIALMPVLAHQGFNFPAFFTTYSLSYRLLLRGFNHV